jgi:hypothetical protein
MRRATSQFQTLYDFALKQIACESYLDRADLGSDDDLLGRFMLGNNNSAPIVFVNGRAFANKLLETYAPDPSTPILPGATRMTATQADYFLGNWRIVHHYPNDPSGFSATLIQSRTTGEYTLALRSTEFPEQILGGHFERDVATGATLGADLQIGWQGFAFGQLLAMERCYRFLRGGGVDRDGSARGPLLPDGAKLFVTGYSLGGHLAPVFTELHASGGARLA